MIDLPVLILILAAIGLVAYFIISQIKSLKESLGDNKENLVLMEWLKDMKTSVDKNSDVLEKQLHNQRTSLEERLKQQTERMDKQTKLIWERLTEAQKVIGDVNKQIGGIEEFGKDIKDLSNVLKSPKLRGGLGEQFLNELLANALPHELFRVQYEFKDGSKCDAAILTEKGIIPVDSKFSLENFRAMVEAERDETREKYRKEFVKDVKKRIDEIATKYLKPDEGTTDFALMYVPSETVYYDIIVNNIEVEEYSQQKNVFITSPSTLFSKLKIFLAVYQQFELQKHAQEILKALASIKIEAVKFDDELSVLEKHISNASKASENVRSKYTKLFGKIENVNEIGKEEKLLEDK